MTVDEFKKVLVDKYLYKVYDIETRGNLYADFFKYISKNYPTKPFIGQIVNKTTENDINHQRFVIAIKHPDGNEYTIDEYFNKFIL